MSDTRACDRCGIQFIMKDICLCKGCNDYLDVSVTLEQKLKAKDEIIEELITSLSRVKKSLELDYHGADCIIADYEDTHELIEETLDSVKKKMEKL